VSRVEKGLSVAIASWRRAGITAHEVVVDPLGDQTVRLVEGSLWVMDAIKRRAGMKGRRVTCPMSAKFTVGSDNGALTTSADPAEVTSHVQSELLSFLT